MDTDDKLAGRGNPEASRQGLRVLRCSLSLGGSNDICGSSYRLLMLFAGYSLSDTYLGVVIFSTGLCV